MSFDAGSAAALVSRASAVLLDFDGPICRLFADVQAADVAADLRGYLEQRSVTVPDDATTDPLAVLRMSAHVDAGILADLHAELVCAEVRAVGSAAPTAGAHKVIRSLAGSGRKLAVVSNNSARAVREYLTWHCLEACVSAVSARTSADPSLMKPNTYLLEQGLSALEVPPSDAVFVGDSVTDVEASIAAGMPCIGYANKPGKADRLAAAGAVEVIDSMTALL